MIIPIKKLDKKDLPRAGEKAYNLSRLNSLGYNIPKGISVTEDVYRRFLSETGLFEKIQMELARRDLSAMRWEELWDASLRIRNLFSRAEFPSEIYKELKSGLEEYENTPVVVRSSAPGEDSMNSSFAGIHESYVDVKGMESIIYHLKLVWASLWSDKALLYRQELGLDVRQSSMAVIVQELISGEVSGVAFSKNPMGGNQSVIEAVAGLNQNLVDGKAEPERWIIDQNSGEVVERYNNEKTTLLNKKELETLYQTLMTLHEEYGTPVDLEWTMMDGELFLLQVRPVTTVPENSDTQKIWEKKDKRPWYRTLTKSFETLKEMRRRIEGEILPEMEKVAAEMQMADLESMIDKSLSEEILKREAIYNKWHTVYWQELIPFAHGVRLFGQLYNDTVKPADPYEFTKLLQSNNMISVGRNRFFGDLVDMVKESPELYKELKKIPIEILNTDFSEELEKFIAVYGNSTYEGLPLLKQREKVIELILNMADAGGESVQAISSEEASFLEQKFLSMFKGEQLIFAEEMLDLARASWRIRDDDNLYLGKLESALTEALDIGIKRIGSEHKDPYTVAAMLTNYSNIQEGPKKYGGSQLQKMKLFKKENKENIITSDKNSKMKIRKYTGQPAGPGIASGQSRVIKRPGDIFDFKKGEVLVCDAIDPNMTFIVPFASAIVERRGGMLIHGAIIAREYGIPCVTGVDDATGIIDNGLTLIVDGYMGTVTIKEI